MCTHIAWQGDVYAAVPCSTVAPPAVLYLSAAAVLNVYAASSCSPISRPSSSPYLRPDGLWCWGLVRGTGHTVDDRDYYHACVSCGKGHCERCIRISAMVDRNVLMCDCNRRED